MQRRWFGILALTSALVIVIAACGRVNLEDLTPEAVKTEQAQAVLTQTAVADAAGEFLGDATRGKITWDTRCIGCHAETGNGVAPDIRGSVYLWPEWEAFFREGTKADGSLTHETERGVIIYESFDLPDESFFNVFAYIAQDPNQ